MSNPHLDSTAARYPIRAVAKLTGLSVDTLRAWERRYAAVSPVRSERGRLYSDADVRRLALLRVAVERGHAIGQVASLSDGELGRLAEGPSEHPGPSGDAAAAGAVDLRTLFAAVERYDGAAADRELGRFASLLGVRDLVRLVVLPLLRWVGTQWAEGRLSIAQEHVASTAMRNLLGTLVRLYAAPRPVRTIVFATPAGERHEFGILSGAMLAAGAGLGTVFLGVDLPAAEIVRAARATSADAVVLGVVAPPGNASTWDDLRAVRDGLAARVEVWVGGCASERCAAEVERLGLVFLATFDDLERELARLGARF